MPEQRPSLYIEFIEPNYELNFDMPTAEYEADREPLHEGDRWLKNFLGAEPDPEWFANANAIMATGSRRVDFCTDSEKEITIAARDKFYEDYLGLGNLGHPLHSKYLRLRQLQNRINGVPIDTFVGTMRVLDSVDVNGATQLDRVAYGPEAARRFIDSLVGYGIDPKIILTKYDRALARGPEGVHAVCGTLRASGLEAKKMLERFPQLLGYATTSLVSAIEDAQRLWGSQAHKIMTMFPSCLVGDIAPKEARRRELEDTVTRFNWQYSATELAAALPTVLGMSKEKLATHKGLFAQFGYAEMPLHRVAGLLTLPLENHIIALVLNPEIAYERGAIEAVLAGVDKAERRQRANELLAEPCATAVLGARVITAYTAYAARPSNAKKR